MGRKALDKLDNLVTEIQKQYGVGSIMDLRKDNPMPDIERIPIESPKLADSFGNGGFPRGRIVEIYGHESSGKTTLAEYIAGQFQKHTFEIIKPDGELVTRKGMVLYIDMENAIDLEHAIKQGFELSQCLLSQPDSAEQAFDIAQKMAASGEVDLIVIDSIAAMTPLAEIEAEMDQQQMGLQARVMSKGLRKLNFLLKNSGCSLIAINQIRMKIGVMFGNPETTTGGMALRFYSSVRIELRKKDMLMDGEDTIGFQFALKVIKNKTAPPMKKYLMETYWETGINPILEWVDFAIKSDVIIKSGAWFALKEPFDHRFHGKPKMIEFFEKEENRELFESIIQETKEIVFPKKKNAVRVSVDSKEDEAVLLEIENEE
jgi:recombination protein RecA